MTRKVAFVTGASRGIGKACAVRLARAGFDVAVTARTVSEGEEREHSSTVRRSDTRPLPGSLATTAALVEQEGARAMAVAADLLDRASLGAAVATVLERWGRIDVLVNNGRYIGPGHMDVFTDTPIYLFERHLEANVLAPLVLCKQVLPGMLERGDGVIVNVTSPVVTLDPRALPGEGGWGLGYPLSKAALHRVAGCFAVELGAQGIRTYNLDPGFVATERMALDTGLGFDAAGGAPPEVVGAALAWLATAPEAAELNGTTVWAQPLAHEKGLVPGWSGPVPNPAG
jgi:NAD(P)-dependent dehydrogenase (short-subunit alcohol dehydrogenase family)